MNLALVRSKKSFGTLSKERTLRSASDRALQTNIQALEISRNELKDINEFLRGALNLPSDKVKGWLAKVMHFIIPQSMYSKLPNSLVKFVAEEYDVLELIERLMRSNINNVQEALKNLAICAVEKRQQMNELRNDIGRAKEEGWDAQRLHRYILEKASLDILPEIAQLLDREFNLLQPEEKEKRKEELILQLESNVVIGQTLTDTMGRVCSAGLGILHRAASQYFDYINVYQPTSVIRDAAHTLTDTNNAMYASKDAVVATFETSLRAIETAVEAARMVNNYSIASADMKALMENGQKSLTEKLTLLETEKRKNVLALPTANIQALDQAAIEIQTP